MKAAIGFDRVVEILHKFQAPNDVSINVMCHPEQQEFRMQLTGPVLGKVLHMTSPQPYDASMGEMLVRVKPTVLENHQC